MKDAIAPASCNSMKSISNNDGGVSNSNNLKSENGSYFDMMRFKAKRVTDAACSNIHRGDTFDAQNAIDSTRGTREYTHNAGQRLVTVRQAGVTPAHLNQGD
jgi:hypothetical protein